MQKSGLELLASDKGRVLHSVYPTVVAESMKRRQARRVGKVAVRRGFPDGLFQRSPVQLDARHDTSTAAASSRIDTL